jgi:hypothetical protein
MVRELEYLLDYYRDEENGQGTDDDNTGKGYVSTRLPPLDRLVRPVPKVTARW